MSNSGVDAVSSSESSGTVRTGASQSETMTHVHTSPTLYFKLGTAPTSELFILVRVIRADSPVLRVMNLSSVNVKAVLLSFSRPVNLQLDVSWGH